MHVCAHILPRDYPPLQPANVRVSGFINHFCAGKIISNLSSWGTIVFQNVTNCFFRQNDLFARIWFFDTIASLVISRDLCRIMWGEGGPQRLFSEDFIQEF